MLDNSVAMRWCFERGAHPYADAVLRHLAEPEARATVPVLWFYEAANVLVRAERQGILDATAVGAFVGELRALPIAVDPRFAQVFTAVRALAVAHRLTVYDAAYLETAQRHRLPLATLDDELIRASRSAGVAIFEAGGAS